MPTIPPTAPSGARVPPSGTVTFLFTDIEGSTQLLQRIGSAYAGVLTAHQRLLRDAWAAHAGYEVDTQGDSFFVSFSSAIEAVAAAVQATQALAAHSWPDGVSVRVRMGLHTGMPDVLGESYVGIDVHRAARIAAAGHGGQILLSETTMELARDRLPQGVSLRDLGAHRLKDLLRPEPLYQLALPGLPDQFPPLKTVDRAPNNLPNLPTPLIGRERELGDLRSLLLQPEVRLVTLLGTGGAGKTSLALQLAADRIDSFPEGVYFVALASVTEGAFVIPSLAQTLGIQEVPGEPLVETIRTFVREKRLLLVFDNLEQIVEATAALVATLLAAAPHIKVIATSRASLHVRGEREYPVPPLGLPDPRHLPPVERLSTYPAVQLFVQRAVAVHPTFALTAGNAAAVAQVCVVLDGLPLAIELAAARVKVLSPAVLAQRLAPPATSKGWGARLRLLTGGARDLPTHQRALADTIAWSYDLLTEDERALYRRLAVFVGGWALDAAEAVSGAGGPLALDVLDGLTSLAEKSLIRQEESAARGDGDEVRFGMLQVIREFGLLRLEETGEMEAVRAAHAQYFTTVAEEALAHRGSTEDGIWFERLEHEHENLLAALLWAREAHNVALGLRLAGLLGGFWSRRGYFTEGRTWLAAFLALASSDADQADVAGRVGGMVEPEMRIRALGALGFILSDQGDYAAALQVQEEALVLARASGNPRAAAGVLMDLGVTTARSGDVARAEALFTEGLALARAHHERLVPILLGNLGELQRLRRDWDRAEVTNAESLRLAEEQGDAYASAAARANLGLIALARGDAERAARLLRASLRSAWERSDRYLVATFAESLAAALAEQGEDVLAARLLGMAEVLWEETGTVRDEIGIPVYEQAVAQVRAHLGEADYTAALAAGRAANREEEIPTFFPSAEADTSGE